MVTTRPAPIFAQAPPCLFFFLFTPFFPLLRVELRARDAREEIAYRSGGDGRSVRDAGGEEGTGTELERERKKAGLGESEEQRKQIEQEKRAKGERERERGRERRRACRAVPPDSTVRRSTKSFGGSRRSMGGLWSGTPDGDGGPGGWPGGELGGGPDDRLGTSFFVFSTVLLVWCRSWVALIGVDVCV